jgi:hypothetical protein
MLKSSFVKVIHYLCMAWILFLTNGCGVNGKEPIPFFDGLYLVYKLGSTTETYKVRLLNSGEFEVIETEQFEDLELEEVKMIVDPYGKVKSRVKDGKICKKGYKIHLWLPKCYRKEGASREGFCVINRAHWEKWDVWVAKDEMGVCYYYEANTGFFVGWEVSTQIGRGKLVLVNTNADIPTIE